MRQLFFLFAFLFFSLVLALRWQTGTSLISTPYHSGGQQRSLDPVLRSKVEALASPQSSAEKRWENLEALVAAQAFEPLFSFVQREEDENQRERIALKIRALEVLEKNPERSSAIAHYTAILETPHSQKIHFLAAIALAGLQSGKTGKLARFYQSLEVDTP